MASIKVVDLFAGPGGLAEGFSRCRINQVRSRFPFQVIASAEKNAMAHATLRLRAFYRICERNGGVPESYFQFLRGEAEHPAEGGYQELWDHSGREALNLTLGDPEHNAVLERAIKLEIRAGEDWVLIGGPPCQAYSVVGRARNRAIKGYRAEDDHRHYLYREYLRLLAFRGGPVAFVMENVKGMLSARVDGSMIFPRILKDLSAPGAACGLSARHRYRIHALTSPAFYEHGESIEDFDPSSFVVRAEDYGVPQARHRVILVGIRSDIGTTPKKLRFARKLNSVGSVISALPEVRCGLTHRISRGAGSADLRTEFRNAAALGLKRDVDPVVWATFKRNISNLLSGTALPQGREFILSNNDRLFGNDISEELRNWIESPRLGGVLNHVARPHMAADLLRYAFCSSYAQVLGLSPKSSEFPIALAPRHNNWHSGEFADRFRVQVASRPASTITSHISKDGHYFIHPSPFQCRSLTVREAARLQTFADDYSFCGGRTAQFHQIGNAVPPFLAAQIAESVMSALR
jgi:DNA (cytosine-5)-methyltransferase 1